MESCSESVIHISRLQSLAVPHSYLVGQGIIRVHSWTLSNKSMYSSEFQYEMYFIGTTIYTLLQLTQPVPHLMRVVFVMSY